ncbi:TPA: hypothetical protein ACLFMB_004700 [Salmonella enterica subsp. diarizonae serovar 61:l,v:1,5,7]
MKLFLLLLISFSAFSFENCISENVKILEQYSLNNYKKLVVTIDINHIVAKQKSSSVRLSREEEGGIVLTFDGQTEGER